MNTTLPTDSAERKNYPLLGGLFGYFAAALVGVARHSWKSNEKHNPGEPLHWSIDKSNDHAECVLRHTLDLHEMMAEGERSALTPTGRDMLIDEANALAWRALALCQTLHMKYRAAPLPFNARTSQPQRDTILREGYPSPRCENCPGNDCTDCSQRDTRRPIGWHQE